MKKIITIIMAVTMLLSTATGAFAAEAGPEGVQKLFGSNTVVRAYGADRYDTSIAAADALKKSLQVSKFENIIVACGGNYPDALSGSYLAKVKNAPVLLVNKSSEGKIRNYINSNLASGGTVYLLGGTSVVSGGFERSLKARHTVKRLSGSDRYDTNIAILKEAGIQNQDILVCSGNGFADSLSASAVGKPILIVNKSLNWKQKNYLSSNFNGRIYAIGGSSAVSNTAVSQLKAYGSVTRVYGQDRYETSIAVAKQFWGSGADKVVLAAGWNFPDGLSGGPLAIALKSPLILVGSNNSAINKTSAYTKSKAGATKTVVLGGPVLISNNTAKKHIGTAGNTGGSGGSSAHVHEWYNCSDYRYTECKAHAKTGDPMFFASQEDMYLHKNSDDCWSSWGSGYNGVAARACYGCDAKEITGHVHDFDTAKMMLVYNGIECECGMSFTGGKNTNSYYTALDSWNRHVTIYTSHGEPREEHDTYQVEETGGLYYVAEKTCSCGWLPVDKLLEEKKDLVKNGAIEIIDVRINGVGGYSLPE